MKIRQSKWARAVSGYLASLTEWQRESIREGRPWWYRPMSRETSEVRRATRRKQRRDGKDAIRKDREPKRFRGTEGWQSW